MCFATVALRPAYKDEMPCDFIMADAKLAMPVAFTEAFSLCMPIFRHSKGVIIQASHENKDK